MLPELKNCNVGIFGLEYVGLPLVLQIARKRKFFVNGGGLNRLVSGFDINNIRIQELKKGLDGNKIFTIKQIKKVKKYSISKYLYINN